MPRHVKSDKGNGLGERIGRNIKLARVRRGMTQGQLADAVGIEGVTVSRIETGAQLPSLDRLNDLACCLKVTLPMLVGDPDDEQASSELFCEVLKGLPVRERNFIYEIVVRYAQHWRDDVKL